MSAPLVSCVIPAHNYGAYLGRAIDSALQQRWPADRLEVIVVNDGSTDDTAAVMSSYGDRIRAIHQPHAGVNAANDRGIAEARGELITFLDADDEWPRDRVRVMARALARRPGAGLVYGDMSIVDVDGTVVAPSFRQATGLVAHDGPILGRLLPNNCVSGGATMVRASLRDRFHPFPAHVGWHDWWIALQVARVAEIAAIDTVVNHYRSHGENLNLAAQGDRHTNLLRAELGLRRWIVTSIGPEEAGVIALAAALESFDRARIHVAAADGIPADLLLPVTDAEREESVAELHRASDALDEGELAMALAALVRAAGLDPASRTARDLVSQLTPHVVGAMAGVGGT
jgi:glycosyltransferase involved in cell wall biosynthesis